MKFIDSVGRLLIIRKWHFCIFSCVVQKAVKIFLFYCLMFSSHVSADLLQVGPGKEFIFPSMAAKFAQDGDVIEIYGDGYYDGDVAVWRQSNITIKGVSERPHIRAKGAHAESKAIWVVKGNDVVIENIEFSGVKVPDKNGAGIRSEGSNLTIKHCYFHDNENGILTGGNPKSEVIIEDSEFARNGYGKGKTHNIYVGRIRRLVLRNNFIHDAKIGHNVKSRALETHILYNHIMDGPYGTASYQVDLPDGGMGYLIGNVIQQGPRAENSTLVAFGLERSLHPDSALYLVNNTIVNDRHAGIFFRALPGIKVYPYNNIFAGKAELPDNLDNNFGNVVDEKKKGFMGAASFDYRLKQGADAVDNGIYMGHKRGVELMPQFEYSPSIGSKQRPSHGLLDAGAFEYIP